MLYTNGTTKGSEVECCTLGYDRTPEHDRVVVHMDDNLVMISHDTLVYDCTPLGAFCKAWVSTLHR